MHVESRLEHCMHMNYVMMWLVNYLIICGDVYMMMFVIWWFLVHLVIWFDDSYFGDSNEVWIICIWFGDFFDDDFLTYTFGMMNYICWVN